MKNLELLYSETFWDANGDGEMMVYRYDNRWTLFIDEIYDDDGVPSFYVYTSLYGMTTGADACLVFDETRKNIDLFSAMLAHINENTKQEELGKAITEEAEDLKWEIIKR